MPAQLVPVAENLWLMRFPLSLLGAKIGRNVSVIRLKTGRLVIHSTAPFSDDDIAALRGLGEPGWLAEAMLRHDTFSEDARKVFPSLPFLAPEGLSADVDSMPLLPIPAEWSEELDVLEIEGAPTLREHVFLHRPSGTLVVADLLFNFGPDEPFWTELVLKVGSVGGEHTPGMPRAFKTAIEDESAFRRSMAAILSWDFNRIIVGHGNPIADSGREKLRMALRHADLEPGAAAA